MSDALRRGIRTGLWTVLSLITSGAIRGVLDAFDVQMTDAQYTSLSLLLVPGITWLANALEDAEKVPALLKAPASDGANPVPNDAGHLDLTLALLVFACCLAALAVYAAIT